MRKSIFVLSAALLAASVMISCKENDVPGSDVSDEICFGLAGEGFDMSVQTKADAVTSVSSVYWEAVCASDATKNHAVASYSVKEDKVSTGFMWPKDEISYNYMVSNVSFTTLTGEITATNATDIVVGTATGVTKSTSCNVDLDHIFARTGTVSLSSDDYTVSEVSWTIVSNDAKSGTAGTYTIGSGWGATAKTALASQALTSDSDLYIIPASYTVGVTFTLTKGAYSETFTKSAALDFVQGKVNNIVGTVGDIGGAKEIEFGVKVTAWGSEDLTPTFE